VRKKRRHGVCWIFRGGCTLGNHLQMTQENGQTFTVLITDVSDTAVTLDANHALAGRELVFDLKLVEIV